jgi:hypothetical protein
MRLEGKEKWSCDIFPSPVFGEGREGDDVIAAARKR